MNLKSKNKIVTGPKNIYRRIKACIRFLAGRDLLLLPDYRIKCEIHGGDYGGWGVVCDALDKDSTVLSFGVGTDASFDLSLIEVYGLSIQAFDPTPKSAQWVKENITDDRFHFHRCALSDSDGKLEFHLPEDASKVSGSIDHRVGLTRQTIEVDALSLFSICSNLKLSKIDYLKMDIEGAEYGVIHQICELQQDKLPKQLAVEFHHFFKSFSNEDTLKAIARLRSVGYKIVWSSATTHEVLFHLNET